MYYYLTFGHKVGTHTFFISFSLVITSSDGNFNLSTQPNSLFTFLHCKRNL